jgi:hypothetical protein
MKDLSRGQSFRHPSLGFFLIIILSCLAFPAQAANSSGVIISEIAWMGGEESFADEWIELYNNADENINLERWTLKAADGTPEIRLEGTIFAKSFFLLERTDDDTAPAVAANQFYTGALGNTGEKLALYDSSGNLIEMVNCGSGWFAGDNSTKQTMERKNSHFEDSGSGNWQTSQNPGGTPKDKNSPGAKLKEEAEVKPLEEDFTKAEDEKTLVTAGARVPESSKSLSFPLIASATAIFSGITILFLKKRIKRYNKKV